MSAAAPETETLHGPRCWAGGPTPFHVPSALFYKRKSMVTGGGVQSFLRRVLNTGGAIENRISFCVG